MKSHEDGHAARMGYARLFVVGSASGVATVFVLCLTAPVIRGTILELVVGGIVAGSVPVVLQATRRTASIDERYCRLFSIGFLIGAFIAAVVTAIGIGGLANVLLGALIGGVFASATLAKKDEGRQ